MFDQKNLMKKQESPAIFGDPQMNKLFPEGADRLNSTG